MNGGIDVSGSYNSLSNSLSMSTKRQIGEEMIIEKMNRIFDEVAKDHNEFEESYQETSPKKNKQI